MLSVHKWTSQALEQQQSKGLDTHPGVRLAGNKARGYTKSRTTWPVRRFNKVEYNLQQVTSLSLLHYLTENLGKQQQPYPLPRESRTPNTFRQGAPRILVPSHEVHHTFCTLTAICTFTIVPHFFCNLLVNVVRVNCNINVKLTSTASQVTILCIFSYVNFVICLTLNVLLPSIRGMYYCHAPYNKWPTTLHLSTTTSPNILRPLCQFSQLWVDWIPCTLYRGPFSPSTCM